MLRDEMELYTKLTGEDATHVPIIKMGAYLDGYEKGLSDKPSGKWILDDSDNSITCCHCSCMIWASDICNGEPHYCPNCGAKMVEPQESEDA